MSRIYIALPTSMLAVLLLSSEAAVFRDVAAATRSSALCTAGSTAGPMYNLVPSSP